MLERQITKICAIAIIAGLIGLYFVSQYFEPNFVELKDIDTSLVGKVIATQGTVSKVNLHNSTLFLGIEAEGKEVGLVFFNFDGDEFKQGDEVRVSGEVSLYKGELEIIGKKISKI